MSCYRPVIGYRLLLVVSLALLLGLLPIFLFSKPASGVNLPPSGVFTQERLVGGLTAPTAMAFSPDGRLFVAQQAGTMQVANTDGTLQDPPFLDISSKVNAAGERGLLGVAFDPGFDPTFATTYNNYAYDYYTTVDTSLRNRVSRFCARPCGSYLRPSSASPASCTSWTRASSTRRSRPSSRLPTW